MVSERPPTSSSASNNRRARIATLWSIDPDQPRESLVDALIRSSTYYRARGEKDPVFGWGKVDAYDAALRIERGGCVATAAR